MTIRDRSGYQGLIDRYRKARSDSSLAVLEGFHSLKHALRFRATIVETVSCDSGQLSSLTESLAPDLIGVLEKGATQVPESIFKQLSPVPPYTGVISLARRPAFDLARLENPAPLVLLENPRSHGNAGAVIRVAAAAGASGVVTTGEHDPWHPSALVGSAGLHFALPVVRISLPALGEWPEYLASRQLIAVDPEGSPLEPGSIPEMSVLAFGTERDGLSGRLLDAAHRRIAIPMEPGVSSLNLATAVAVALYTWRLG
ncbi:MAG: rRNA methyltransferase [Chloroflexota bacterium]|nr:rRNA methyltransferase [Chloroflexota bacterium]